jgi:23S rRNA (uracil1939-C5)-methyltransferase
VTLVVLGASQWSDGEAWAEQVRNAVPMVTAVWWDRAGGTAILLSGAPERSVLAFAQVNPVVADALRACVREAIDKFEPRSVIDAYSGRGDLAEFLSRAGVCVTAIEADRAATLEAEARLAPFAQSRVVTARVEGAIESALPADVVVLNPPRRGVDVRVAAALANARDVRAIVYVSCDPATLARDVSRLPHWRIDSLRCFDMFPQTAHVESVCVLIPEAA